MSLHTINARLVVVTAFAAAATALTPARADAAAVATDCSQGIGAVQLGFGGFFSGCWAGFRISSYFENAQDVSDLYWFTDLPATGFGQVDVLPDVAPTTTSDNYLFNNDCGSNGSPWRAGAFCAPMVTTTIEWGGVGELVFGLNKPDQGDEWLYSGTPAAATEQPATTTTEDPVIPIAGPAPQAADPVAVAADPATQVGTQNYLWQITSGQYAGQYLLAWEDLTSGCQAGTSTTGSTGADAAINALSVGCTATSAAAPTVFSDDDYNDFYVLIQPLDQSQLSGAADIAPEPVTMALLATGLLGLGGASLRRRRR